MGVKVGDGSLRLRVRAAPAWSRHGSEGAWGTLFNFVYGFCAYMLVCALCIGSIHANQKKISYFAGTGGL